MIVVGVYALQKRFRKYYDFTIWVGAPREVRIARMIKREGEAVAREWQEKWLPREERYLEIERPDKLASVVLDDMSADKDWQKQLMAYFNQQSLVDAVKKVWDNPVK